MKVKCSNKGCGLITDLSNWVFTRDEKETRLKVSNGHCPRCFSRTYVNAKPGEVEKPLTGAQLIALERTRQMKIEGWTSKHDDQNNNRQIASAALGYVGHYVARAWTFTNEFGMPGITDGPKTYRKEPAPDSWPWDENWWKPTNPMRDLVKAGALIAAEIDRLQRAQAKGGKS